MDEFPSPWWETAIIKLIALLGFVAATAIVALTIWGLHTLVVDGSEVTFSVVFGALWCLIGLIGGVALGLFCLFGLFSGDA